MGDADFWELLTKHGIRPDSATAIVGSHRGMSDADLWERLTQNGATPDDATQIVKSRAAPMGDLLREQGLMSATSAPLSAPPAVQPDATAALARNRKNPSGDLRAALANPGQQAAFVGKGLAANALNAAQAIPGAEAFEAGMGSLGSKATDHPMNYEESLNALRGETSTIPAPVRMAEKMAFGASALPTALKALPAAMSATPARAGATIAAADVMGQADPNVDLKQRLRQTAVAAPSGMALGKMLSMGRTAVKANGSDLDQNLVNRDMARSAASGPKYNAFRALGDLGGGAPDPKLSAILDLPVVRRALRTVQAESPTLAALPPTDANVLDAVYKRVGDKAFTAKYGFETEDARVALKSAIDDAANSRGGSYADPVDTFHEHSQGIGGVERGRDALTNALGKSSTTNASLDDSPAALRRDLPSMADNQRQGVVEGIYGQAKKQGLLGHIRSVPVPLPSAAFRKGDALANQFDPKSTDALLALLGIGNAPVANP